MKIGIRHVGWLLVCVAVAGCSRRPDVPLPTTYPVTGRVVTGTGEPVRGGAIQFQSTKDSKATAICEIQPDGTFSLSYPYEPARKRLPGTIAGPHKVTIIPAMSESQTAVQTDLPQTYTVEPRENHFTITLDSPKRCPGLFLGMLRIRSF